MNKTNKKKDESPTKQEEQKEVSKPEIKEKVKNNKYWLWTFWDYRWLFFEKIGAISDSKSTMDALQIYLNMPIYNILQRRVVSYFCGTNVQLVQVYTVTSFIITLTGVLPVPCWFAYPTLLGLHRNVKFIY